MCEERTYTHTFGGFFDITLPRDVKFANGFFSIKLDPKGVVWMYHLPILPGWVIDKFSVHFL